MEQSTSGKLHTHLVLQFRTAVDKTARCFTFKSHATNASVNDLLNEGLCRNRFHHSVDRSFFLRLGRQGKDWEERVGPTLCSWELPICLDKSSQSLPRAGKVVRRPVATTPVVSRALRGLLVPVPRRCRSSQAKLGRGQGARERSSRRRGTRESLPTR